MVRSWAIVYFSYASGFLETIVLLAMIVSPFGLLKHVLLRRTQIFSRALPFWYVFLVISVFVFLVRVQTLSSVINLGVRTLKFF